MRFSHLSFLIYPNSNILREVLTAYHLVSTGKSSVLLFSYFIILNLHRLVRMNSSSARKSVFNWLYRRSDLKIAKGPKLILFLLSSNFPEHLKEE